MTWCSMSSRMTLSEGMQGLGRTYLRLLKSRFPHSPWGRGMLIEVLISSTLMALMNSHCH